MKKRILTVAVCLCMIVCLLSSITLSTNAATEGAFIYSVSGGNATVTGLVAQSSSNPYTSLTVPSTLGGYPVTVINSSVFSGQSSLTYLSLPSTLTIIGASTFQNCSQLTSLSVPSDVTYIGQAAFSGCSKLASLTLPSGITSISQNLFSGCSSLSSLTIPAQVTSIGPYAFNNCSSLTTLYYEGTSSQWSSVSKATYWNSGASFTVVCLGDQHTTHDYQLTASKEATCSEEGYQTYTCTITGCTSTYTDTLPIDPDAHGYDSVCDADCNLCSAERIAPHNPGDTWLHDSTSHWKECAACHESVGLEDHSYTVECAETCAVCERVNYEEVFDLSDDNKVTAFDAQIFAEALAGKRVLTPGQSELLNALTPEDILDYILGRFD